MKRIVVVAVIALVFAMQLSLAQDETYTFALVPKNTNNPFFDQARDGCYKAQEELAGQVECLYVGPGEHGSGEEQVKVVQDLITQGVDGIAVAPSNAPAMAIALKEAEAAGIPVITWDSDLLPEDKALRLAYVGTYNYDIGVNLAKLAQALKPEGGTLCIQSGGEAAANHNERMQGIRDTLSGAASETPPGNRLAGENGWTEIDACPLYTNDDFQLAVQQMADILGANPELDAFIPTGGFPQFVPNAYRQVAEEYKDRLDSKSLALVVADTLPDQIQFLRDGLSLGQVGQRPFEMGYQAMYMLLEVKNGATLTDPTYTGLDVCTPENVDTCVGGQ